MSYKCRHCGDPVEPFTCGRCERKHDVQDSYQCLECHYEVEHDKFVANSVVICGRGRLKKEDAKYSPMAPWVVEPTQARMDYANRTRAAARFW